MAAVTERPIILPGWAVHAIRHGLKTQTRRIVQPIPTRVVNGVPQVVRRWRGREVMGDIPCPYGTAGDRLWVREPAWLLEEPAVVYPGETNVGPPGWVLAAATPDGPNVAYQADMANPPPVPREGQRWNRTSPLHLPRGYSRLTLEVVAVKVESLRSISEADAEAEFAPLDVRVLYQDIGASGGDSWRDVFATTWDEQHCATFQEDPVVWCCTFRVAP